MRYTPYRSVSGALLLVTALVVAACDDGGGQDSTHDAGTDAPTTSLLNTPAYADDVEPGPVSARRLTQAQFTNIIRDVFGDIVLPSLTEPDVSIGGLLAVGASGASFSARGVESLEDASFAIAEQAMDSEAIRAELVTCTPEGVEDAECATQTVRALGRRLWRRPLDEDELERIVGLAGEAAVALDDFFDGLEYAIAALLQSPNFLFRTELGDGGEGPAFDDFELAARLSFFLWNTSPDDELLDAAEAGELSTDEGLRVHAERMIEDPRTRRGMRNFFSEFLELHELEELRKDPTIFEHFSTLIGPDAREETLLLMEHVVFDAEMDYRDIATTRETFVNPRLAALYDIPAPVPDGFGYVRLPADGTRAGILGHVSFLANHSHQVSSSATLRGVAVRQTLLCASIPPPPVDVDTSIPEPSGDAPTLRDRVAEHLENEVCASCHLLTDPIGLGLENFDGIGRWRLTDGGAMIDPTGELDGTPFNDPRELGEAIRNHPAFPGCLVRTLTRYATGRVEERPERAHIDVMTERFAAHEYRVKPLLLEVVMSPMFRNAGAPQ